MGCVVAAPFWVTQVRCGHKGSGSLVPLSYSPPGACDSPQCQQAGKPENNLENLLFPCFLQGFVAAAGNSHATFLLMDVLQEVPQPGLTPEQWSSPWGMSWVALPLFLSGSHQRCVQRIKSSGSAGTVATAEVFLNLFSWYWKELLGTSLNSL